MALRKRGVLVLASMLVFAASADAVRAEDTGRADGPGANAAKPVSAADSSASPADATVAVDDNEKRKKRGHRTATARSGPPLPPPRPHDLVDPDVAQLEASMPPDQPALPAPSDVSPAAATSASGVTTLPQSAASPAPTIFDALTALLHPNTAALLPQSGEPPPLPPEPLLNEGESGRTAAMRALVAKHAAENGVPFGLADAVVRIESGYRAHIMHAGNYGLMQLRAATARGMGFSGSAQALLDPETNLHFGMKYLGTAYKLAGGDTCRTIMRYQSGLYTTRFSSANRAYCARAQSMMAGL